jgi:hypothetical protein
MPSRFASRKFILALVGQIVGLLVLFFPEHATPITEAGTHIGALLLMALSGYGFIQGEARIDAARVAGEQQQAIVRQQIAHSEAESERGRELQQRLASQGHGAAVVIMASMLLFFVPGCNGKSLGGFDIETPKGQYDVAQEAYIAAIRLAVTAKQSGKIDQASYDADVLPLLEEGDQLLDKMEAAALADDSTVLETYRVLLEAVNRRLLQYVAAKEGSVSFGPSHLNPHHYGRAASDGMGGQGRGPRNRPGLPGEAEAASQGTPGSGPRGGVAAGGVGFDPGDPAARRQREHRRSGRIPVAG